MYATYAYNAGASMAQVMADVVALICGGSVASLSASCNKALSTVAGAASPYSAPSAQSYGVVQANCLDGVSKKIFRFTLSGQIMLQAYDTWNGATNTGTNPTTARSALLIDSNPGTVWIVATDEILAVACSYGSYCGIGFEFKREAPFMAGTSRPCWGVVCTGGYAAEVPRAKNMGAAGDQQPAAAYVTSPLNGLSFGSPRGTDDLNYNQLLPCFVMLQYGGYIYAGAMRGALCAAEAIGAVGDIYSDENAATYLLTRHAAPAPSHKTIVVLRA